MTVTAIFTDDGLDQVIQMDGPGTQGAATIVKREVRDLRNMGCAVRTRQFDNEQQAYDYAERNY